MQLHFPDRLARTLDPEHPKPQDTPALNPKPLPTPPPPPQMSQGWNRETVSRRTCAVETMVAYVF